MQSPRVSVPLQASTIVRYALKYGMSMADLAMDGNWTVRRGRGVGRAGGNWMVRGVVVMVVVVSPMWFVECRGAIAGIGVGWGEL